MKMATIVGQENFGDEDSDGEELDPRIQDELERLNHASVEINQLELELDEARAAFRQVLSESTQKLSALSKKLGSSIEKARPYYTARIEALEAENETRAAALRFERAFSMQQAAKEMVFLAEQGYFRKGQPFDMAWQEMLNHATIKVNEAEEERLKNELEHQQTASIYNDLEQRAKHLQKKLKSSIVRSRPYFEMKANFNQVMEERKHVVSNLERQVLKAKKVYSNALNALETISDEIHKQRNEKNARRALGQRGSGVGAETPTPPPDIGSEEYDSRLPKSVSDFSTQTDENESDGGPGSPRSPRTLEEILKDISPNMKRRSLKGYAGRDSWKRRSQERGQELNVPQMSREASPTLSLPIYSDFENEEYMKLPNEVPHLLEKSSLKSITPSGLENEVEKLHLDDRDEKLLKDFKRLPNTHTTEPKSAANLSLNLQKSRPTANTHIPSISIVATNSGQDVKRMPPPSAPLKKLKPRDSDFELDKGVSVLSPRESIEDDVSDAESVCSSVNVMDDEQLQYLMKDDATIPLPEPSDEAILEREKWKTMPAKLSYLEYYMKYKMEEVPQSENGKDSDDEMGSEDEEVVV